jgi:hypothetical protein
MSEVDVGGRGTRTTAERVLVAIPPAAHDRRADAARDQCGELGGGTLDPAAERGVAPVLGRRLDLNPSGG